MFLTLRRDALGLGGALALRVLGDLLGSPLGGARLGLAIEVGDASYLDELFCACSKRAIA